MIEALPAGALVEIELSGLDLTEQMTWPNLAGGPVSAPQPAPQPTPRTEQKDARDFCKPAAQLAPQAPQVPQAPRASPWRAVAMLLVGLALGAGIGYFAAGMIAPAEDRGEQAGAQVELEQVELEQALAAALAELKQASQRIAALESENAALAARPKAEPADAPVDAPADPPADTGALEQALEDARRGLAESEGLARRQATRIGALEAEVASLEAALAEAAAQTPAMAPPSLDAGEVDRALAQVQKVYAIDEGVIADVRAQLLAGDTVKEISSGLSGRLPNTARQSLHNQLCKAFSDQCR